MADNSAQSTNCLQPEPVVQISENVDSSVIDSEKKISQLENENFVIAKQLEEVKKLLKESSNQNEVLKERLNTLEADKIENLRVLETLEKSRNDLVAEKTQLLDSQIHMKTQKDTFESELNKNLTEKRRLAEELQELKTTFLQERKERSVLQARIDEFECEKNLISFDKERWAQEKEILLQGKQWYMDEISSRENKLNELRIETMKLEADINRERQTLNEERDQLSIKVSELNETLARKENELTEIRNRLQKVIDERAATLNEIDSELRTKERLTELYKTGLDVANSEISTLKENETRIQNILQENEITIMNLNTELEKITAEREREVNERDASIKRLNEELTRANDLLKIQAKAHRTDEEIAALSPAAAAASKLIRSGISLTSIYTEHCRVVAELEEKKAENERIEQYVTELIQELDAKAPLFREQREFYENSVEEIKRLNLQNKLLLENYQKLQNNRDSIARELLFAKADLERYQHEHHVLSLQVRRLLYNIERSNEPLDTDLETEEFLFSNIEDLHNANLELISKIKKLEGETLGSDSDINIPKSESIKTALENSEREVERLRELQSKTDLLVMEITTQRDNYKSLYEEKSFSQNISPTGGSMLNFEKSNSDLQHWKSKAELLQEKINYFTTEKQESDKAFNDRIDQQMVQISQLRTTNGKLESALEFQKKNQQLLNKSIDELEKNLKTANETISRLNIRIESLQSRHDDLNRQIVVHQQEISQLKISNHSLDEALRVSKNNEQRSLTELGILRESKVNAERVALTLQEVESVLKRVDTDKESSFNSQLQSACIERDNLKKLVEEMNTSHVQLVNNLKSNINSLTGERNKAQEDLRLLQEVHCNLEKQFISLKEEQQRFSSDPTSSLISNENIGCSSKEIEEFKNQIASQEKQINELGIKCGELNSAIELKEKELQKLSLLSSNLESVVKEQNEGLLNKENEIISLKDQLVKSTEEIVQKVAEVEDKSIQLMKSNNLLTQAKTLARNFRDSSNKLEKERDILTAELEKAKSELTSVKGEGKPAEASTSWTNVCAESQAQQNAKLILQQKISEIQKISLEKQELLVKLSEVESTKIDLEKKLAEMKTELEEANEKCFRLDSITSMLQQSRRKNEQLRDELIQKDIEMEDLKRSLAQSPSRKRPFSDLPSDDQVALEAADKRSKTNEQEINFSLDSDPNFLREERLILDSGGEGNDGDIISDEANRGDFLLNLSENEEEAFDEEGEEDMEGEEYDDDEMMDEHDEEMEENCDDQQYQDDENDGSSEIICLSEDDEPSTTVNETIDVCQQKEQEQQDIHEQQIESLPMVETVAEDSQPSEQCDIVDENNLNEN